MVILPTTMALVVRVFTDVTFLMRTGWSSMTAPFLLGVQIEAPTQITLDFTSLVCFSSIIDSLGIVVFFFFLPHIPSPALPHPLPHPFPHFQPQSHCNASLSCPSTMAWWPLSCFRRSGVWPRCRAWNWIYSHKPYGYPDWNNFYYRLWCGQYQRYLIPLGRKWYCWIVTNKFFYHLSILARGKIKLLEDQSYKKNNPGIGEGQQKRWDECLCWCAPMDDQSYTPLWGMLWSS